MRHKVSGRHRAGAATGARFGMSRGPTRSRLVPCSALPPGEDAERRYWSSSRTDCQARQQAHNAHPGRRSERHLPPGLSALPRSLGSGLSGRLCPRQRQRCRNEIANVRCTEAQPALASSRSDTSGSQGLVSRHLPAVTGQDDEDVPGRGAPGACVRRLRSARGRHASAPVRAEPTNKRISPTSRGGSVDREFVSDVLVSHLPGWGRPAMAATPAGPVTLDWIRRVRWS